jgi:predicted RNase H-like nuclease
MRVTGVDAYRGGWVAVELTDGTLTAVRAAATLRALLADTGWVTGIDMPLGLLGSQWRAVDRLAAARLGPRRSSVFPIPQRPVWVQPSHAEANKLCRELTGRGLSAQTWGLRTRLLEADEYREACTHPFYEVHPELAFAAMAGAPLTEPVPLADSKHTEAGLERRRELLAQVGITLPRRESARTTTRTRLVAPLTDMLDAAAVAWSAHRIATDTAAIVSAPETDDQGREIAIHY